MGFVRSLWKAVVIAAVVAGCSGSPRPAPAPAPAPPPPPPPPTVVELTLAAGPDVNPDESGRPSPVVVRIYQLADAGAFGRADFFQLYQNDGAVLGGDLLHRDEVALSPGETRALRIEPKPATREIGVVALFRRIDQATWRGAAAVPLHKTTPVTVRLDGVTLALTTAPPAARAH